jgi:Na+-translocating ferredoxin:NAD+ oxidoreductase subunit C
VFGPRPAIAGGIHLPMHQAQTRDLPIRQMAFAPLLSLPLRQHAGPPALAVVREGQDVERGDLLARAGEGSSVPLHAPASGRVLRIDTRPGAPGEPGGVIHLAPFPGATQEYGGGPGCDPERASPAAIIAAIRAAGIVGPGGEGLPAHARLSSPGKPVRLLLLNGIAGDACLTRDYRVLCDHRGDLLLGARYLLRATGAERVVLAVEEPDANAARAVIAAAATDLRLEARIRPARYPQGAEHLLVAAVLGETLQPERTSLELGVACLDVATVAEIGRLLPKGLGSTDLLLTLAGGALDDPGNYRVPLGTPLRFALAQAGLRPDASRVLQGGPLHGQSLASLELPISKGMFGFVALGRGEAGAELPAAPCIRCGDCLDVCPVQLNPAEMGLLARKGELQTLRETHRLDLCFECGCCAYVCPSRIPLVQVFRAAKARLERTAIAGVVP